MASTDSLQWEQSKRVQNNLVINLAGASISYNGSTARNIYLGVADQLEIANNGNGNCTLRHTSDCVTVEYSGPTSDVTLNPGDTFEVPYIQTKKGHVIRLGTYDIGLSTGILDRSIIVSNLNSPSSVTVPSSTLLKTSLDKLPKPNTSQAYHYGRIEGASYFEKKVLSKTWTNDVNTSLQINILKNGIYYIKLLMGANHGFSDNSTIVRGAIELHPKNNSSITHLSYCSMTAHGGDLETVSCSAVSYLEKGDEVHTQLWTGAAGIGIYLRLNTIPLLYT